MVRFGLLQLFEDAKGKSEKEFYDENIELVEHADQCGLDEVWMAEHHFTDYGVMPSTQVFGSHIAARTKQIRIGTGVVVLPFVNPIRCAEEFAFLDQLSGGRLDFGVGRGYQPGEFEGYGIPFEHSRKIFQESLEIIQQAWTQDTVEFDGEHFQFHGIKPRPQPMQQPTPPMFGASFNPDTVKYQAMQKLNLLFSPLTTGPDKIEEYNQILRDAGENPDDYRKGGLAFVYIDEDREKALHDFEEGCMWYFRKFTSMIPAKKFPDQDEYYRSLHGMLKMTLEMYDAGKMTFAQMVDDSPFSHAFLVGDPEYVRNKLGKLLTMYEGMSDVLCWTRLGGLDHKKVMGSMDLLVNKVVEPMRAEGMPTRKAG